MNLPGQADTHTPLFPKPATVAQPTAAGIVVLKRDREVVVDSDGALPTIAVCHALGIPLREIILAAEIGGVPCYSVQPPPPEMELPPPLQTTVLRAFLNRQSSAWRKVTIRALELATWRNEHRFCGCCGALMQLAPADGSLRCTRCGFESFPILSPAIIVRITRGDHEILLGRNRTFTPPFFSNFAGFVESGETYEDAIRRELQEEVGVEVTNIRYFGSQNWPFPHTLLAAFTAEYASGEVRPDGEEIAEAAWFDVRSPLPPIPQPGSISRAMIDDFLVHSKQQTARIDRQTPS